MKLRDQLSMLLSENKLEITCFCGMDPELQTLWVSSLKDSESLLHKPQFLDIYLVKVFIWLTWQKKVSIIADLMVLIRHLFC
jgi:hypothetical protein